MMIHKFMSRALLISAVALLPACIPGLGTGDKGCSGCAHTDDDIKIEGVNPAALKETVVSFEGKPVVTGEDFERKFQQIIQGQPALKDMLPHIPEEQQDQMFGQMAESMALENTMLRWVRDEKIDQTPEFRRNAKRAHEAVDRDLALRAFESELLKEVVISDDEAKKFYDENRATDPIFQRPPFVESQGGVKAKAFEAANEKEARDLAAKAKASNFAQVAKDAKKTVNDYGLVSQQSFIDDNVKNKILDTSKFPSVEVVKGKDGKFRVVNIISKQDTKRADFDKVKDAVKHVLTGKKFNELYNKKMAELKEKYKVEVNKDYVQKRKLPKPAQEVKEEAEKELADESEKAEPAKAAPARSMGVKTIPVTVKPAAAKPATQAA